MDAHDDMPWIMYRMWRVHVWCGLANASTYYPPEPTHSKHDNQATRGAAARSGHGVFQPERSN